MSSPRRTLCSVTARPCTCGPSTTEDVPRLRAFLAALSEQARWFRFFSAGVNLDAAAAGAAAPRDGLALIALREGAVVAHATFIRETPDRAEVA
jgi:hypothetical protein